MLRNGDRAKTIWESERFCKIKRSKAGDRAKAKNIAKSGKHHGSTSQEFQF